MSFLPIRTMLHDLIAIMDMCNFIPHSPSPYWEVRLLKGLSLPNCISGITVGEVIAVGDVITVGEVIAVGDVITVGEVIAVGDVITVGEVIG